jgi:hypothetical protein
MVNSLHYILQKPRVKDLYLIVKRELELLAVQVPHTEFETGWQLYLGENLFGLE